jgi:hypothetical protein
MTLKMGRRNGIADPHLHPSFIGHTLCPDSKTGYENLRFPQTRTKSAKLFLRKP